MKLDPLGNGFCRVTVDSNAGIYIYYFRGKRIPEEIIEVMEDPNKPSEADMLTCEMGMAEE